MREPLARRAQLLAPEPARLPQRVLILSAAMGEGHNAAADAVAEAMGQRWPGCWVHRQDTYELRGERVARYVRKSYEQQLSSAPWSYAFSYHALARYPQAAAVLKAAMGQLFGPPLARVVRDLEPDIAVSTYPFGSAALHWLRRHRGCQIPTATYVPAFHVHPVWAYTGIDLHYVLYASAAQDARSPGFSQSMRLGAPTVKSRFGQADREQARQALGVSKDRFVVLFTGGSWGLGPVQEGVEAILALGGRVHVAAVCGHNQSLRQRLGLLADQKGEGLTVLGYVHNMPDLMAAADVVVTNGAGNTVLEALRSGRPVIAFSPLAGHGTASSAQLARQGLAVVAADVGELADHVRRLATEPCLWEPMSVAARSWASGRDLGDTLAELEQLWRDRGRQKEPVL